MPGLFPGGGTRNKKNPETQKLKWREEKTDRKRSHREMRQEMRKERKRRPVDSVTDQKVVLERRVGGIKRGRVRKRRKKVERGRAREKE